MTRLLKNQVLHIMKYTVEVEINQPIDKVIELFDNPDNLKKWMDDLQSFEYISGKPGAPGAKSKLKFKMGKREIEMIETIVAYNLPNEFSAIYEAKGVYNTVAQRFVKITDNRTRLYTETEFEFKNLMMKFMGFLMPGAFKKQTLKYQTDFKEFAEAN